MYSWSFANNFVVGCSFRDGLSLGCLRCWWLQRSHPNTESEDSMTMVRCFYIRVKCLFWKFTDSFTVESFRGFKLWALHPLLQISPPNAGCGLHEFLKIAFIQKHIIDEWGDVKCTVLEMNPTPVPSSDLTTLVFNGCGRRHRPSPTRAMMLLFLSTRGFE